MVGPAMPRRSGSLWWALWMAAGACGGGSPGHGTSSSGGNPAGTGGNAGGSSVTGSGGAAGQGASTGAGGGGMASKRPWPDSTAKTLILADQLPGGLTAAQQQFVVSHMVGTQKLTLAESQPLRALAPNFLVLHYHLAIWQSAPSVTFIVNGMNWGNDYPTVTMNESWFWHNQAGQRVAANDDGKLLMNIGDGGLATYWKSSILGQIAAGDYDGLFADSASPDLLQWEAQSPAEPRLTGTGARDTAIAELGGQTYVQAWQSFMTDFDTALAAQGVPLIPNTGAFTTSWDTTDYSLTAGVFVEGFAAPSFAPADWQRSMNEILALAGKHKIVIAQNYLADPGDVATRLYYLGNYLLARGERSYLDYFAGGPLEWYPEWDVDLGAPITTGAAVADLAVGGAYEREFANGWAAVNPTASAVTLTFPSSARLVKPQGGGALDASGVEPGSLAYGSAAAVTLQPATAAIVLK
jgi:hypothetical protein